MLSNKEDGIEETLNKYDLLEPQFYPDPVIFKDSLDDLKNTDEESKNKQQNDQTTLNVLAPYLKTIYKDQKKALVDSAKNLTFSAKTKEAKLLLCDNKFSDQQNLSTADIKQQYEMIVSIHETADMLKTLVKANTVVSYLVDPSKNELYQSPRYLLSSMATLTWKIEQGTTMAAYAAFTKKYVTSNNILTDDRFSLGLGFAATIVKYALCVPIKTTDENVIAVYEFTRNAIAKQFERRDIQIIMTVVGWMGFAIQHNNWCAGLMRRLELSDYLLQLTHHYHGRHSTLYETLSDIVLFSKQSVAAERCNFYLVEKGIEDNTIIIEEFSQEAEHSLFKRKRKKTVTSDDGSHLSKVVFSKEIVNKYETQVEINLNLEKNKLRSMICVPVICKSGEVIGIIQLTNKKTASQFSNDDEELLKMFALFFALNQNSYLLQEKGNKLLLEINVDREILLYQLNPCSHDQEMIKKPLKTLPENFFTICWYPLNENKNNLPQLTLKMFHEVLGDFFMQMNDIPTFILAVRNCYRPNPFHNFNRAFNVCHKMATILKHNTGVFSSIECQSLMIASLCLHVDNQNSTDYSNVIKITDHKLCRLYDFSPMENHHFAVTKILIEKFRLFKYLKPETYNKILIEIHELVSAASLSAYFHNKIKLTRLSKEKLLNLEVNDHRRVVKGLMIAVCNKSDQALPYLECQRFTEELYDEFFNIGDLLKKKGFFPVPEMDRQYIDFIPECHIQFLIVVLLPCLDMLSQIFDVITPLIFACKEVLKQWQMLVEIKDKATWKPNESIP